MALPVLLASMLTASLLWTVILPGKSGRGIYACGVALLVIVSATLIFAWAWCPRCRVRLPWTVQRIAVAKDITSCPKCGMSFDEPLP